MMPLVEEFQLLPIPDGISHDVWKDSRQCACGPTMLTITGKPLVRHQVLVPTPLTRWVIARPGANVEMVHIADLVPPRPDVNDDDPALD